MDVKMTTAMAVAVALSVLLMLMPVSVAAFNCPRAFWIFGDSLSDTGNTQVAFPSRSMLNRPYGISYTFHDKPGINRYSDGRLVVDFIAQAFLHPFYGTYLHVLNRENYLRGANFAYAGATANASSAITPFYLDLQVAQFLKFKNVTLTSGFWPGPLEPLLPALAFSDGAYIIPEIGGNDFFVASLLAQVPPQLIIQAVVPAVVAAVRSALTILHDSGGRLFFVFNVPPQGCNPAQLTAFAALPKDSRGCVAALNDIDQAYGVQLQQALDQLRTNWNSDGTEIYLFDYYNATLEIIDNSTAYGFTNTNQSCCGVGGPYNWNPTISCGNSGTINTPSGPVPVNVNTACATPNTYMHWDGIHYTQAFYRTITKFFLEGHFLSPPLNLKSSCFLTYANFN